MKIYTKQDFEGYINQVFSLKMPETNINFTLQDVVEEKDRGQQARKPFSLFFSASAEYGLNQGLYNLNNQTFGDFAVFLVPIEKHGDADNELIVYQALFN